MEEHRESVVFTIVLLEHFFHFYGKISMCLLMNSGYFHVDPVLRIYTLIRLFCVEMTYNEKYCYLDI